MLNNIKIDLNMTLDITPIQKFLDRVAKMAKLKQDIRLTVVEALEISACLASLLANNQIKSPEIQQIQKMTIDGGMFKG